MACKVCGGGDMAKAHIFPRALLHEMKDGGKVVYSLDGRKKGARHYQSGPWEPGILCQACEAKLSQCDDYAVEWIRSFSKRAVPVFEGRAFEVPNPKPHLLVQFAASVLWRAAVAERMDHPDLDLGPWEPMLREAIFNPQHFQPSVIVGRKVWVISGEHHGPLVVHPFHSPGWAKRAYVFEIGNLMWALKLDDRQLGKNLFSPALCVNGKTTAPVLNLGELEVGDDDGIIAIYAAAQGLVWSRQNTD